LARPHYSGACDVVNCIAGPALRGYGARVARTFEATTQASEYWLRIAPRA
jgi:hypothetical protein